MFKNKFSRLYVLFFLITIQLYSCLTAGTHGSIKSYDFPVSKKNLQKAVEKVITESTDIQRDTAKNYMVDITNGKNDTIINDRYNDGQNYVTIKIETKVNRREGGEYTFQYVGDKKDWDTLKTSTLSIAYAYDENNNGGSKENVRLTPSVREKLTSLFESKFIDRIKKELGEK